MLLGRNKYEGIDPVNRSYDEMAKAKEAAERERQESAVVSEEKMNSILRKFDKIERIIRKDKAAKERNTVAGAFFEKLAAGINSHEDPAKQHVTTAEELKVDILVIRKRYTSSDGLDAARYCSALNSWRDNILFTAGELKTAAEEARRSGDPEAVPGYEVMIKQYQTNAGILAKEIKSVGGIVNK